MSLVKIHLPGLAEKYSAGSRKRWCKLRGSTMTKLLDLSRASNICSWTYYFLSWNCMDQFGHFMPCSKEANTTRWLDCARLLCKRHTGYLCDLIQMYPSQYCQNQWALQVEILEWDTALGQKRISCWSDAAFCKTWLQLCKLCCIQCCAPKVSQLLGAFAIAEFRLRDPLSLALELWNSWQVQHIGFWLHELHSISTARLSNRTRLNTCASNRCESPFKLLPTNTRAYKRPMLHEAFTPCVKRPKTTQCFFECYVYEQGSVTLRF